MIFTVVSPVRRRFAAAVAFVMPSSASSGLVDPKAFSGTEASDMAFFLIGSSRGLGSAGGDLVDPVAALVVGLINGDGDVLRLFPADGVSVAVSLFLRDTGDEPSGVTCTPASAYRGL